MKTFLIGFGYRARHGKDTAVQAIIDARGGQYDVRRYAFADELKREVTTAIQNTYDRMTGYDPAEVSRLLREGRPEDIPCGAMDICHAVEDLCKWARLQPGGEFVAYEPNPDMSDPLCPYGKQRTLLQWWGSEYRRRQNRHYWVDALEKRIEAQQPQIALISDVRFPNEYDWIINKHGGEMVKVERTGFSGENAVHQSERALADVTFPYEILVDEGDVIYLKKAAVDVFDQIIASLTPEAINLEQMRAETNAAVQRLEAR